jgi:hypothetical protein
MLHLARVELPYRLEDLKSHILLFVCLIIFFLLFVKTHTHVYIRIYDI